MSHDDYERCDGCNEPIEGELIYCPECCYDLCEDCLESGFSLDGRHSEECRQTDDEEEDEESLEPALDRETNTQ